MPELHTKECHSMRKPGCAGPSTSSFLTHPSVHRIAVPYDSVQGRAGAGEREEERRQVVQERNLTPDRGPEPLRDGERESSPSSCGTARLGRRGKLRWDRTCRRGAGDSSEETWGRRWELEPARRPPRWEGDGLSQRKTPKEGLADRLDEVTGEPTDASLRTETHGEGKLL